jgi:hypothetical protein
MLDFEQGVGDARDMLTVSEVGPQHPKLPAPGDLFIAPEQRFHAVPGEEIWMDNLIRIAAQQKRVRHLEGAQHEQ